MPGTRTSTYTLRVLFFWETYEDVTKVYDITTRSPQELDVFRAAHGSYINTGDAAADALSYLLYGNPDEEIDGIMEELVEVDLTKPLIIEEGDVRTEIILGGFVP